MPEIEDVQGPSGRRRPWIGPGLVRCAAVVVANGETTQCIKYQHSDSEPHIASVHILVSFREERQVRVAVV